MKYMSFDFIFLKEAFSTFYTVQNILLCMRKHTNRSIRDNFSFLILYFEIQLEKDEQVRNRVGLFKKSAGMINREWGLAIKWLGIRAISSYIFSVYKSINP